MQYPTDFRGVPITEGSIIVYPGRRSSFIWMNEAVVETVIPAESDEPAILICNLIKTSSHRGALPKNRRVTIKQLDRVAVVDEPNL